MTPQVHERLFGGFEHAFQHPLVLWFTVGVAAACVVSGIAIQLLHVLGVVGRETFDDAIRRWKAWLLIAAAILVPILLGAAWTIAAVALLSLGCFWEFARATRLNQERSICAVAVLGIFVLAAAALDHWDRLFFAAGPLTVGLIAVVTIPHDRPAGYLHRVALGALGFTLFGFSLAYLGNLANDSNYRPVLMLLLAAVALNDIFAYCTGKALGRRKILPNTSPGKTGAGMIGALVLTTALVMLLGQMVFRGTPLERWDRLLLLGVLISVLGQLGDLVLSSVKRDVGIKDTGTLLAGHGGLLDRFDSLVLTGPAFYHYLSLHLGPWAESEPARIFSGGA